MLFTEPDLLASPSVDMDSSFHLIAQRSLVKTGKLQTRLQKQGLTVSAIHAVHPALYQTCLVYSIKAKLAPSWNVVAEGFIQGRNFLTHNGHANAVKMSLQVNQDETFISLEPAVVRFPPLQIEDLNVSKKEMLEIIRSTQGDGHTFEVHLEDSWCYVLPSLKRVRIVSLSLVIPEACPFPSYSALKRYWKNTYGYRLPETDDEILYCQVTFFTNGCGKLFTYPNVCLRSEPMQPAPRIDPKPVLAAFLHDLHAKHGKACGQTFRFEPKLRHPGLALYTAKQSTACPNLTSHSTQRNKFPVRSAQSTSRLYRNLKREPTSMQRQICHAKITHNDSKATNNNKVTGLQGKHQPVVGSTSRHAQDGESNENTKNISKGVGSCIQEIGQRATTSEPSKKNMASSRSINGSNVSDHGVISTGTSAGKESGLLPSSLKNGGQDKSKRHSRAANETKAQNVHSTCATDDSCRKHNPYPVDTTNTSLYSASDGAPNTKFVPIFRAKSKSEPFSKISSSQIAVRSKQPLCSNLKVKEMSSRPLCKERVMTTTASVKSPLHFESSAKPLNLRIHSSDSRDFPAKNMRTTPIPHTPDNFRKVRISGAGTETQPTPTISPLRSRTPTISPLESRTPTISPLGSRTPSTDATNVAKVLSRATSQSPFPTTRRAPEPSTPDFGTPKATTPAFGRSKLNFHAVKSVPVFRSGKAALGSNTNPLPCKGQKAQLCSPFQQSLPSPHSGKQEKSRTNVTTPKSSKRTATDQSQGDGTTPKKVRSKPVVQAVDVELLAKTGQLEKANTATLLAWLKARGQRCTTKDRKTELVDKVRSCLGLGTGFRANSHDFVVAKEP